MPIMLSVHLASMPRPGACQALRSHSTCLSRPKQLVSVRHQGLVAPRLGHCIRIAAGRPGASIDDGDLPDDSFLADDAAFADDSEIELDEDEKAILLGTSSKVDSDPEYNSDDDEEETVEELARKRKKNIRGRVVESSADDLSVNLDDIVAEIQRGGALRASQSFSDSGDAIDTSYEGQNADFVPSSYPPMPERRRYLPDLLKSVGYFTAAESAPAVEITNIITCNSENASIGSLYVCVPCEEDPEDEELDGHNWADEAAELGAVAVVASRPLPDCLLPVIQVPDTLKALAALSEEFYDRPAQRMQTIAFVGSYGKTTTSWLARGIFDEAEKDIGIIGDSEYAINTDRLTLEGDIWVPTEEDPTEKLERSSPFRLIERAGKYELPPTTPDALHLQKVLAGIADRGGTIATVEVCPEIAADGRIDCLHPAVLVFTNVDKVVAKNSKGGEEQYIENIKSMFSKLDENQTAIINLDDPLGPELDEIVAQTPAQALTYGEKVKTADVCAEKTKVSNWETEIMVRTPIGRLEIIIPIPGTYNVLNALAAVAVGLATGVKLVSIVAGVEAVEFVPGRTEVIDEGQPFPVIIDGAKTPEQIGRLIDEVKEAGARRTILVIGCPGGTSPEHRAAIGSEAHFKADVVFFTNDSPGLDPPSEIIQDIVNGLPAEVLARHAGSYFPWLQDVHRTPQWYESWLLRYQSEVGRYIIEDRYSAIRVAIGMAKPRDVVLVVGRGQDDRMEYWDGVPPPRTHAERAVGQATKSMADPDSPEYLEEENWEMIDEYYAHRAEEGLPVERETITGWFDDSIESRNAIMRVAKNLNKLKDLDRSTLPWTRYPEEREHSGLSGSMGMGEATGAGGLDRYLKDMADGNESKEALRVAVKERNDSDLYDEDEDEDDDDDEEEAMMANEEPALGVDLDALVEDERANLEDEREKHHLNHPTIFIYRAEKFGVDYRDPGRRREFRDDARKERIDPSRALGTGFDLFTEEEIEKRNQRAARFNMPDTGLQWNPPEVPEDEEKKKARAERFGVDYQPPDADGLMDVDLFETRKEAPPEVPRRPEAVHIYGVDLMSTSDVLKYFKDYGPTYVEWLNDSSANVLFKEGATAKRAIAGLGKPLTLEDLPEGVDAADPANIQYLWHKGEDFLKAGSNLPLVFRMATILDVKPSERVQSRRLWLSAGGGGGGGGGRGGGRGGRKFHKVRRSQDGTAMQHDGGRGGDTGGGGGGGQRARAPPGWQHDDRFGFDGNEGGVRASGEIKGRGQTRFNKRKSGDGGDQFMRDAGGARRQKMEGQEGNIAPLPARDTVSYDDL